MVNQILLQCIFTHPSRHVLYKHDWNPWCFSLDSSLSISFKRFTISGPFRLFRQPSYKMIFLLFLQWTRLQEEPRINREWTEATRVRHRQHGWVWWPRHWKIQRGWILHWTVRRKETRLAEGAWAQRKESVSSLNIRITRPIYWTDSNVV